ncbi:TRAP transporter TatT component family protein [Candidatus Bipolaricaulota sp. J31]
MSRGMVFCAVLIVLSGGVLASGEHEGLLPAAAELYPQRYEYPVLERLIGLYEGALVDDPSDRELLSRLAQFWYEKAMLVPEEEKKACFERARDYALAALRANLAFVEMERKEGLVAAIKACDDKAALLWYAASQGQLLGMINPLSAFRLMKPVRAAYERVAELEETFWGCSALHALGAFEANMATTPVVNLLFGASLEVARGYFERAIELCPDYLENYYVYARDYAVPVKDAALFRRLLRRVLEAPIGGWPFWNRIAKMDAEALIAEHPELWGE